MNIKSIMDAASKSFKVTDDRVVLHKKAFLDILAHKELTSFSKNMAIYFLSYNCNNMGLFMVYPSYKYLADIFNVKQATIGNAIRNLKDNYIIYTVWDKFGRRYKRKAFYIILPLISKKIQESYMDFLENYFEFDRSDIITKITEYRSLVGQTNMTCELEANDEENNEDMQFE